MNNASFSSCEIAILFIACYSWVDVFLPRPLLLPPSSLFARFYSSRKLSLLPPGTAGRASSRGSRPTFTRFNTHPPKDFLGGEVRGHSYAVCMSPVDRIKPTFRDMGKNYFAVLCQVNN